MYAARDLSLKRDVAVKALRADLHWTPDPLKRFRREAESVARLRHPNIIPIYSVGETEEIAYLVMPLIRGMSLREKLKEKKKLEIPETCRKTGRSASPRVSSPSRHGKPRERGASHRSSGYRKGEGAQARTPSAA